MALSDKVAAGVVSSMGSMLPSLFTNEITTPLLGVGVSTIAGAVLGTYAAIGYDDEQRPRGKLFVLASSTVIIASAATGVLPHALGWAWMSGVIEGGAAALCAVSCYFTLPEAIIAMRRLLRTFKLSDLRFFRRSDPAPPAPPSEGDPGK